MAAGEQLGSDSLTLSKCGPCLNDHKDNEASVFCVECNDMLCDSCVATHRRFSTMRNHYIVVSTDKEQFEFTAKLLSDKCEQHEGKHLETFCKIHDELCCSVCISLSHRHCDGLVYLPEYAREKTIKDALKTKVQAIESLKIKSENLKESRQADKERMSKEKVDSVKRVDDYRKELIKEIDRIYRNFEAELKSREDKNVKLVDEDVKACDDYITDLNKVLQSLNDVKDNDVRSFIGQKRAARIIKESEEKLKGVSENIRKGSLVFILDSNLKNNIQKVNCFGEFENQTRSTPFQKTETADTYNIKIGSSISQCVLPKEKMYCNIQGMALMKNRKIILADWNNNNLKLYSQDMKEEHKISLSGRPRDVCLIDDDICISYKDEHKLQIASLSDNTLQTKQTIDIGKLCRGVSYKNRELYVACGEQNSAEVRVYSLEGKLIRTFDRDSKGNNMFSKPYYINTNSDGTVLYVADNIEGVFALTVDGTLLWRYNDQKMFKYLLDIAVDENDDLYVCRGASKNIVKISSNGQTAEIVVKDTVYPQAICYDRQGRLIVACDTIPAQLHVYQVIKKYSWSVVINFCLP